MCCVSPNDLSLCLETQLFSLMIREELAVSYVGIQRCWYKSTGIPQDREPKNGVTKSTSKDQSKYLMFLYTPRKKKSLFYQAACTTQRVNTLLYELGPNSFLHIMGSLN